MSETITGARPAPRLLDQVREAVRVRHFSIRTEEAYVGWIRRYILFHGKRHPAGMGKPELEAFLTDLAVNGMFPLPRRIRRWLRCCFCIAKCWGRIDTGKGLSSWQLDQKCCKARLRDVRAHESASVVPNSYVF